MRQLNSYWTWIFRWKLENEGAYRITTQICDVESKVWVGFLMDELMEEARYAFFTAYFSQGGQWLNIEKSEYFTLRVPMFY